MLPSVIKDAVHVPPRRSIFAPEGVRIDLGGSLDLEAGSWIRFGKAKGLHVTGGRLTATGTASEPIVFTTGAERPRPGDWCGLTFDATAAAKTDLKEPPSSTLEHVIVEFGGHPCKHGSHDEVAAGIVTLGYLRPPKGGPPTDAGTAGALIVKDSVIRENAFAGMLVRSNSPLSCERLEFGRNAGVSIAVDIEFVERCAAFATEAVELFGHTRRSVRLPALSAPYIVTESLSVGGHPGEPLSTLIIPSGTVMKFKKGTGLSTGGHFPGAIAAHGVTFTSAEAETKPGDWEGISVWYKGRGDFEDDAFEYAGMDGRPALDVAGSERRFVEIRNSRFRKNAGPGIGDSVSCDQWMRADRANHFEDQPACIRGKK